MCDTHNIISRPTISALHLHRPSDRAHFVCVTSVWTVENESEPRAAVACFVGVLACAYHRKDITAADERTTNRTAREHSVSVPKPFSSTNQFLSVPPGLCVL